MVTSHQSSDSGMRRHLSSRPRKHDDYFIFKIAVDNVLLARPIRPISMADIAICRIFTDAFHSMLGTSFASANKHISLARLCADFSFLTFSLSLSLFLIHAVDVPSSSTFSYGHFCLAQLNSLRFQSIRTRSFSIARRCNRNRFSFIQKTNERKKKLSFLFAFDAVIGRFHLFAIARSHFVLSTNEQPKRNRKQQTQQKNSIFVLPLSAQDGAAIERFVRNSLDRMSSNHSSTWNGQMRWISELLRSAYFSVELNWNETNINTALNEHNCVLWAAEKHTMKNRKRKKSK